MKPYRIRPAYEPMVICFAGNDGYAVPMCTAIYSMLVNRERTRCYDILILYTELSEKNKTKLLNLATREDFVTIRNCFASGSSLLGDGNRYPVAKNMGGVIENTYYVSPEATEDGGVTAEYAAAGELCYLLNQNKTEDAMGWYQNIDSGEGADAYPVPDKTHGIVYKGYQGCKTVFTNDQDSITEKPVHKLTYSGEGNVITAVCKEERSNFCKAKKWMQGNADDSGYNKNQGRKI